MVLLDGRSLSAEILTDLKNQVAGFKTKPSLVIIMVGNDPSSKKYVELKKIKAQEIGINCQVVELLETSSQLDVEEVVASYSHDPATQALIVQLPLPAPLNQIPILNLIDHLKDADGLTPLNLGKLFQKDNTAVIPATPLGIIRLLEKYQIDLVGKNAVVIGRSAVVGLPLVALLEQRQATVTLCHSQTTNLQYHTKNADLLISATGRPNLITSELIKPGAVVVDVGSGRVNGQLVGDVDYYSVAPLCSHITPNPGGVGPMTIACLLENVIKLAKLNS
ncbi:MAG: bifunctional 5,10-methylenetetrahydrofolate dehydrogenase/5,10-methenyltetrahydrofolate cyclohydrolase [Candidatus Shapirobacteria bacterium]